MKTRNTLFKCCSVLFFLALCFGMLNSNMADAQEDILTLTQNAGYQTSEAYKPKSSIIISAETGQILWEDQPDLKWNPASIAKLMSTYLIFEAMHQGQFTLDTTIKATEDYQAISQIYELSNNTIVADVDYPVKDLLYAMLVQSSNVATVMLSNLVTANDEAKFVHMMNAKAKELGMTRTTFYNSSGAETGSFNGYYKPEGIDQHADNISTARDLAILSYHLLKNYPETLTYTSPTEITIMANTPYEEVLTNHNYSLPGMSYGYEGVDGLKTGSSPTGGFNYAATAKRGDTRLIEVVLGVGDWEDQEGEYERHAFGNAIFDQAFATYEYKMLLPKGTHTVNQEKITLTQDFYGLILKNTAPVFSLSADKLMVDTDLTSVSPLISAVGIDFNSAEKTTNNQQMLATQGARRKAAATFFANGLFIVLGILLILLAKIFKKEPRQTGTFNLLHLLLLVGGILILFGIVLSIYTVIAGPWI